MPQCFARPAPLRAGSLARYRKRIVEAGFEFACLGPTPMSGFDADKVDAAFAPDGRYRTNSLLKIGYGDRDSRRPRPPRLRFAEAARWE